MTSLIRTRRSVSSVSTLERLARTTFFALNRTFSANLPFFSSFAVFFGAMFNYIVCASALPLWISSRFDQGRPDDAIDVGHTELFEFGAGMKFRAV